MRKSYGSKGFTIMELMIVVVIIGILVSIGMPYYGGVLRKARASACLANQRTIEIARMYNSISKGNSGSNISDLADAFAEIGFTGDSKVEDLTCPEQGTYTFSNDSFDVVCSIAAHNQ